MIDLDRFKQLNDTLGHDAGDFLLSEFSRRLLENLRADDIAARIGGDEFAVLLGSLDNMEDAYKLVERISNATSQPITYGGEKLTPSATIGIAIKTQDDTDLTNLTSAAYLYTTAHDGTATELSNYWLHTLKDGEGYWSWNQIFNTGTSGTGYGFTLKGSPNTNKDICQCVYNIAII